MAMRHVNFLLGYDVASTNFCRPCGQLHRNQKHPKLTVNNFWAWEKIRKYNK